MSMRLEHAWRRQVADLIAAVQASDLTELAVEHGPFALRIERDGLSVPATPPDDLPALPRAQEAVSGVAFLRSPQVGTFYLSAEPHGEPFVRAGSAVEPGQVIGLIEAMKLINEVEAEAGGIVQRVLVDDGQPVEYGQPLFELAAVDR